MSKLLKAWRYFTGTWGRALKLVLLVLFVALLAALAVPKRVGGGPSKRSVIENNLRQLDGAVQQWGIDHHQTGAVVVTWEDVASYLKRPLKPVAGEVYVLKDLAHPPEAVLTRKLGEWPKRTILRFGTNGDIEFVLPKR